ncbi:MAG TPA: VOC family protein [Lysobacter sp.]|jgi:predicted 3-demethylubiquinone-9 3-methyltransferase (glyoxalase superfamily)|nr:VOC family protein [Lysobacter sp.]
MISKIQPCLWFDGNAEEAARFYADTFPDSRIGAVKRAPGDYPAGKKGDVLTVEMTILGMPFLLLNGGPEFTFNEAVSFQVATDDQAETDRYWKAITGDGGEESMCGWCKDRFGLSWQITPKRLTDLMSQRGETTARAFKAMMGMKKIDIAALDRAVEGVNP